MNLIRYQHRRAEKFPFRQIATTSFITGVLMFILGIILLFSLKPDVKAHHFTRSSAKAITALGLIALSLRTLKKGYLDEYKFNLESVYNPSEEKDVNYLMAQRAKTRTQLANIYAEMFKTEAYSLSAIEKRPISHWQKIFYEMLSRNGVSKTIDVLPYPATNFIVNQSDPVALVGSFVLLLTTLFFLSWLDILSIDMTLINLVIFTALLSLWRPSKIDNILNADRKKDLRGKMILFILSFLATLGLYKAYTYQINTSLFISVLFLAAVMITTAILAFQIINKVFSERPRVKVEYSSDNSHVTYKANTQPNNILQQFENIIDKETKCQFKESSIDVRDKIAGHQANKGDFEFSYLYETCPELITSPHDAGSEGRLKYVWFLGTILLCAGLICFTIGIAVTPVIDLAALKANPEQVFTENAPAILLNLFLTLFGIAVYFFGGKLVYEIYMFFHAETFFESNLILFGVKGSFDELKHHSGSIIRTETGTDYTPEIKVCKITSSVFLHPYLDKRTIPALPRFMVKVEKNDTLFNLISTSFQRNMGNYSVVYQQS